MIFHHVFNQIIIPQKYPPIIIKNVSELAVGYSFNKVGRIGFETFDNFLFLDCRDHYQIRTSPTFEMNGVILDCHGGRTG